MSDLPPEEMVKALREQAQSESAAHKMIADAKTARQTDRDDYPELAHVGYGWIRPEQTVSWQAAALIERLEARVTELEGALKPFAMFPETGKHGGKFVIAKGLYEDMKSWWGDAPRAAHLHLSDFRKASKSLAQGEG